MTRPYSNLARIVWQGAYHGRRAARAGHRSVAFAVAEPLRNVEASPLLMRTAHQAAVDIERILYGVDLEADKRDNVVEVEFTVASILRAADAAFKEAV